MDEGNKIELFDPGTIVFFIMAVLSDFCFVGMIGLAIPGVGLAIAMFVLAAHYFFGLVILGYFFGRTKSFASKALLILGWLLPLPLLSICLGFAIAMSNKFVALAVQIGATVATQVVIQAAAVGTGGGAELLEAAAVPAEGAELAATVAEGAEAVGTIAEGAAEMGETAAEIGEAGAEGASAAPEAIGTDLEPDIEKNPLDVEEKELLEESPEPEFPESEEAETEPKEDTEKEKTKKRAKKVRDIVKRAVQQDEDEDENKDEENDEAEPPPQQPSNVVSIDDYRRRRSPNTNEDSDDSQSQRRAA